MQPVSVIVADDKPADKRAHIVNEIIETEEGYLKALRVMVDVRLILADCISFVFFFNLFFGKFFFYWL